MAKKKTEQKKFKENVMITGVSIEIPEMALEDLLKAMAEIKKEENNDSSIKSKS